MFHQVASIVCLLVILSLVARLVEAAVHLQLFLKAFFIGRFSLFQPCIWLGTMAEMDSEFTIRIS